MNWPDHLRDSPRCFQYYKSHAAIVHHVTGGTMPELVSEIGQKLGKRRWNIIRSKEDEGLIGISGFRYRMNKQMSTKCNSCGLFGPVGSRLQVTRAMGSGPPRCKSCADENDRAHLMPISLANRRANLWKTNVEGESDHLVAVRTEIDGGYTLCPSNLVPDESQWVWEGITGEENVMVLVPNTKAAFKTLENMSVRAWDDWKTGLQDLMDATEGSRIFLLKDFKAFIQATSAAYRSKLAAFRKYQIDLATGGKLSAQAKICTRSPKKIKASYKNVSFDQLIPGGILQHFPWSDSAIGARAEESEARNAYYGRVRTMIEVRILADKSFHWSKSLKVIIVRSFERDITETTEGIMMVTCQGGCTLASCSSEHVVLDEFLEQTMVGLNRLARLPLLLNYVKAKLFCFEQTILLPNYSQWDFRLKFMKDTWDVLLVGHAWNKHRVKLNTKIACGLVQSEDGIVKRLLQRPEALETVSLDPNQLRTR